MRENPLRAAFANDETVLNGWLHIPSSVSAEAMAHAGFDSLTVDLQHGPIGFEAALTMLQAISSTPTVPLARVAWNHPPAVMRLLDAGAYGVICPMIDDREGCERFVRACRYPPAGTRSWGPTRARFHAGGYDPERANATVLAIAMVETATALANLDGIVATPGLDAIYVGPADLSQSLGVGVTPDFHAPPLADALARIAAACERAGVVAGVHTGTPAQARRARALGYRFVTVRSDLAYLTEGAAAVVGELGSPGEG